MSTQAATMPIEVTPRRKTALGALKHHWREYLIEAGGLGFFMVSASLFGVLIEHPDSPLRMEVASPLVRRAIMGVAMGLTAIAIIYSPWGKQSGAHINPSVTFTFWRLGKIQPWDTAFYAAAQFVGAVAGIALAAVLVGDRLSHSSVNYVATLPGMHGNAAAFVAEVGISFLLMTVILTASNHPRLTRFTGIFAGMLVAMYITAEAPISGMSMNPARTFGSALPSEGWPTLWIYFLAPPLGMLLAAEFFVRRKGVHGIFCAKLHHANDKRCIFNCRFDEMQAQAAGPRSGV